MTQFTVDEAMTYIAEGAFANFQISGQDDFLRIYTTRPDTMFGVTFMVIAPEHEMIQKWSSVITNLPELEAYKLAASKKSDFERTELVKEKTRNYISSHILGKAGDFSIEGITAQEARSRIRNNAHLLPCPIRVEGGVSWLHFDVLPQYGITAKVYEFSE